MVELHSLWGEPVAPEPAAPDPAIIGGPKDAVVVAIDAVTAAHEKWLSHTKQPPIGMPLIESEQETARLRREVLDAELHFVAIVNDLETYDEVEDAVDVAGCQHRACVVAKEFGVMLQNFREAGAGVFVGSDVAARRFMITSVGGKAAQVGGKV